MAAEYLFVYGTLRRGTQIGRKLLPQHLTEFVGNGLYQGKLFELGGYPGAVPSDAPDDRIRGEVYLLHEPQAILKRLDEYEGCSPQQPEPHEYKRVKAEILLKDGGSVSAWVYLFNRPTAKYKRIVSGDYIEFIKAMRQQKN